MLSTNPFQAANENNKPLLQDGAMGSYLQQKGFDTDEVLWTSKLNLSNTDQVKLIYEEYIKAGADIITTNTFRTNPSALKQAGTDNPNEYVRRAVEIVKEVSQDKKILIAGSNAPAEDCYQSQRTLSKSKLEMNHRQHIDLLIDNGVDFILNETQSHFNEIQIICKHCENNRIPFVVSLYVDEELKLLSGEKLESVISFLNDYSVLAVGFNCISPDLFLKLIGSTSLPKNWGFYLNCGDGHPTDKVINCKIQPDEYLEIVKKALPYNPSFIGSCCGSNPNHIKKIREFLSGKTHS
jgi:homocysteine S-methyltransferase